MPTRFSNKCDPFEALRETAAVNDDRNPPSFQDRGRGSVNTLLLQNLNKISLGTDKTNDENPNRKEENPHYESSTHHHPNAFSRPI
jgi:hypothetical protein